MSQPIFDLTNVMQRIGSLFVSEMRQRMISQVGVDGNKYLPLKPATIRQKMKISAATAAKRMIRTKDFLINAFRFQSKTTSVKVFISNEPHGRELRMTKQTVRSGAAKNLKKSLRTTKNLENKSINMTKLAQYQLVTGASNFFPQSETEIENMQSFKEAMTLLEEEAYKQANEKMIFSLSTRIQLGH
jgi:hypothetical protein